MAKFSGPSRHPPAIFTSRILQWGVFGIHERKGHSSRYRWRTVGRLGVAVVRRGSRPKTIRKISGWLKLGTTFSSADGVLCALAAVREGSSVRWPLADIRFALSNVRSWVKRT